MFSNNDKISSRQIKRLLVFDLFGVSSLLLPARLARAGGGPGLWCIVAGATLAGLYLWLVTACFTRTAQDYMAYLGRGFGKFLARLIYLCYAVFSVSACAWAAKLLSELICDSLLDSREYPIALLLVLFLALYGGIAGLEARARIYEILFWVLAVPLAAMLLLCIRQVQVEQWFPLFGQAQTGQRLPLFGQAGGSAAGTFWSGTVYCFAAFLPLTFLLFLAPHVQDKKKARRAAAGALAISGVALAAIYLILLGIFGSAALAQEEYPAITLMGMVKIPGDFLKRLDAVMVGVWFFTLYALIGSALYYGVVAARKALMKQSGQFGANPETKREYRRCRNWWFAVTAAVVYGMAYGLHMQPQAEAAMGKLFYLAGVPFLVLVPMVSLILC